MGFFKKLFGGGEPKLDRKDIGGVIVGGERSLDVSDVFTISGRGYAVFGTALRDISVGEPATLLGHDGNPIQGVETTSIIGITLDNQEVPSLAAGAKGAVLVATPTPIMDVIT